MNSFFKPVRTIFFFVISGIAVLLILFTYAKLAVQPVSTIVQNKTEIERGSIVDRSGFPLAVQTNFYHVGVSTKNIRDDEERKTEFAQNIAPLLDLDESIIKNTISSTKSFVYLKKKIDSTTFEAVKKLTDSKGYNFVSYEKIPGRNYPNHDLASQLIGYMGDDGKGLAGIEFSQQEILSPEQPEDGEAVQAKNIFLSIDANLQYKLEKIARKSRRM